MRSRENSSLSANSSQVSVNKSTSESTASNSKQKSDSPKLKQYKFKNLFDKAKVNQLWLDSSKSLMEQDVSENDLVRLRFKYYAFYDLNPKLDVYRIDLLYEQAKLSILSEFVNCSDQELITLAALQAKYAYRPEVISKSKSTENLYDQGVNDGHDDDDDDVDAALNRLEMQLELNSGSNAVTKPLDSKSKQFELKDYLQVVKKPKSTFKRIKTYFVHLNGQYLNTYKTEDQTKTPIDTFDLKNCDIQPDVQSGRFSIYLNLMNAHDICLRCFSLELYAKWLAALKLLAKSNSSTFDENLYKYEIETIMSLADMQKQEKQHYKSMSNVFFEPDNYVPARLLKKCKAKQLTEQIMEIHSKFNDLDPIDTKLRYINFWRNLADFGISFFNVKFKTLKAKEEILGLASNRMLRYNSDLNLVKSWPLSTMKSWNVNWDSKQFEIEFDDENVIFYCSSPLNPKVLHEFIGGYIFMSLRTQANTNQFDKEMFFKLTNKR